jgi:peptidoglycan/xylan/chitin deacetylase (PgdA/CDA1 family)
LPWPAWAWSKRVGLVAAVVGVVGCTTPPPAPPPAPPAESPRPPPPPAIGGWPGASGDVAGRSDRLLIYLPRQGDTLQGMAARFLGSADLAWRIADANGQRWKPVEGEPVIVPLVVANPVGITADGIQTIPILCYHRFGFSSNKMTVTPAQFEAQLQWLARNHYRVLRLGQLPGFLAGREPLPQRSVVITIDDGYESVHRHALPLLRKYGVPATLFVYTDFVGAGDAMSWSQLRELARSGLVDIQAHSKTHRNLIQRAPTETDTEHRRAIDGELRLSRATLERWLAPDGVQVRHFAYPYGDADDLVLESMRRNGFELGVTVHPGGNAFYADPLLLRRTMIFGDHDLDAFKARLQVHRAVARP